MKEFSSKLGGFGKFKAEMSEGNTSTGGIDPKSFDLSKTTMSMRGSQVGQNKGLNAGGPNFSLNATQSQSPTLGAKPTGGIPTGYNSNDGVLKNISDNVTNNVNRGNQSNFGTGINNQKSFAKQPTFGNTDLSHLPSNQEQKLYNGPTNTPGSMTIGNQTHNTAKHTSGWIGTNYKKQVGRGVVTQELFGKVGENN